MALVSEDEERIERIRERNLTRMDRRFKKIIDLVYAEMGDNLASITTSKGKYGYISDN